MEHENNIDNSKEFFLYNDTLLRLEWQKITHYLAHFAIFPHSKMALLQLTPWISKEERNFYFKATREMLELHTMGQSLSLEPFDAELFKNLLPKGAVLSPLALFHISISLKLAEVIQHFFKGEKAKSGKYASLCALAEQLHPLPALSATLKRSIDAAGSILSSASPELESARSRYEHAKRKIVEQLETILKKQDIKTSLQDNVWMLRDGRYVLPVRTDRKSAVEGIPRGVSQSGSTVFIEPHALSLQHAQLEKAQTDIEIEENRIILQLSKECYQHFEVILKNIETLTEFDKLYAQTKLASLLHGVEPTFLEQSTLSPRFRLTQARHPLFLLENKKCVANDLYLEPQHDGQNSPLVWVLSGPNAGGKTVAMKTIGITVLMAKAGLFVACEKAEIIDYENIFVELGDRQSREDDLSTFSGHLAQIKRIAESANDKTLILLDEGFVGTDPAVGVAMARSTLEFFCTKNATVIITTHFSNLKTLADNDARFCNGSMEFEPSALQPTYKLLNGIPGQSYAIELAIRMGLDNAIIQNARKYYGSEAQRMENILKELQLKNIAIKKELHEQEDLTKKLEKEFYSLQKERQEFIEHKKSLVNNYRTKLQKRLNAFENRLEIRERQFEKLKDTMQREFEAALPNAAFDTHQTAQRSAPKDYDEKQQEIPATLSDKNNAKPKKLTSFEDLSKLKLIKKSSTSQNSQTFSLDEKAEKFRAPKHHSSRALLDEAKLSLQILKNSYDTIEDSLHKDIDHLLHEQDKTNAEQKQSSKKIIEEARQQKHDAEFWQAGMKVRSQKFKENGTVLKPADSKGIVECQFGMIKVKVPHYDLTLSNAPQANNPLNYNKKTLSSKKQTLYKSAKPNSVDADIAPVLPHSGNSIDLRGKTVDDALDKLDLELDKMNRMLVQNVVVIHGHGLGKVKEAVRKYLETTSYKLRFRNGRHGEGGDGVTIIEFDN
ncbi:MAG: hypothetical protein DCC88_07660 [Spirobacillus cienkowskii]|uniref:Endonuclease MutS2 n=1 Tax=Spirobacillus cienkowskii TaxID=495820 RepID=A0A369KXL7_9BACT|nr:MAG: hypothetical protein DCC88_07660 [Spirobacillus cienkowskii]